QDYQSCEAQAALFPKRGADSPASNQVGASSEVFDPQGINPRNIKVRNLDFVFGVCLAIGVWRLKFFRSMPHGTDSPASTEA
ncbi:MAG TPA: hypothetical protein VIM71_13360, partial [Lacunisphaera sp.]